MKPFVRRRNLRGLGDDGSCGPLSAGQTCVGNGVIQLEQNPIFQTNQFMCSNGVGASDPSDCAPISDSQRGVNQSMYDQQPDADAWVWNPQTGVTSPVTQQQQQPVVVVPVYHPQLSFQNLTTGVAGTIVAGRDQWRLSITGAAPNVPVSVTAANNNGSQSSTTYGSTDASGNWIMTGSSSSGDIGQWTQTWKAGSDVAGTLWFQIVAPATQQQTTTQQQQETVVVVPVYHPQLSFQNLTTGDAGTIVAGRDQWRVSITGAAPNVQVSVTARRNGGTASTAAYSNTDASGNWSTIGSSDSGDIGQWSEIWTAGSDVAGTVNLAIVAPASTPDTTTTATTSTSDTTVVSGGGFFDDAIEPVQQAAQQLQDAVSGIPSIWIWAGAIGAAVLLFHGNGRKK
jgi:hypothetical protein